MLKKLPALLLALTMLFGISSAALAENGGAVNLTSTATVSPQPTATAGTYANSYGSGNPYFSTTGPFSIDTGYVDKASMNASYADGYAPTVKDGKVYIVLPLTAKLSDIQSGQGVTTTLSLSGAPFVAKNYSKSLTYSAIQQNPFVLQYEIQLQGSYQSGTYAVPVTVYYTSESGASSAQTFQVNVLIAEPPKPSASSSAGPSDDPSLPVVSADDAFSIATSYFNASIMNASYAQGYVPTVAGDTVDVVLPLYANLTALEKGANVRSSITLDGAPFVAKNYQNEWQYATYDAGFLLLQYRLDLQANRENGTYAVPITLTYKSALGEVKTQTFSVNVIITDAPEPTPSPTSTPAPGDAFSIDPNYFNADIMKSSYSQGYTPIVSKNTVDIVLPLSVDRSALKPGAPIRTTVALTGKPFIARNYENKVEYADLSGNLLLVRYNVGLESQRENGTYPVPIDVSYTSSADEEKKQTFNINVLITDGTAAAGQGPQEQPKVILANYKIEPSPAYAGEVFKVTCTLKNTNKSQSVKNMTVTYTGETTDLMPESGANTTYISSIPAEGSEEFSFSMEARADAKPGPQKIMLSVSYEDSNAQKYDSTDTIVVQIKQEIRLTNDDAKVPDTAYVGESVQTTLNLYNKGKNTLYNVTVNLNVPGLTEEQSAFLGNMESGASKTAEIYAMVDESETGQVSGSFLVSYEDEYGDSYELEVPVELEIMDMQPQAPMPDTDMTAEPAGPTGLAAWPWWVWVLIGGSGLITALSIIRSRRKKRRERRLMKDIDDDDIS